MTLAFLPKASPPDCISTGQEEDREALVLDHRLDNGTRFLVGPGVENLDDLEEQIAHAAAFLPITAGSGDRRGGADRWSVGRRIEELDAAARRIMANTLSERLPVAGKNDDLDRLAMTLNRTSDGIAHERSSVRAATSTGRAIDRTQ